MTNTELTLPSGKNVKLESGKGYHLLNAQRKAKTAEELAAEKAAADSAALLVLIFLVLK